MKPLAVALLAAASLICGKATGQKINWNDKPKTGFVFQITNREAQRLLTRSSPDTIFNGLLHTVIDTFDISQGWIDRPEKGHFIISKIKGNKLQCEYIGLFPYQVLLMKEYGMLTLQVLDREGTVREDARVKLGGNRIPFDPESKTYRFSNAWFFGNERSVTVETEGFRSVFNVQKHDVPTWYSGGSDFGDRPTFYSYMITDKNRHRPGDKVRFKSYALSQFRSPINSQLEVWLVGMRTRKVGVVSPHRPGGFAGELLLHDSLKLRLDFPQTIQLRDRKGRVVANTTFTYEDYELNGDQLDINLSENKQFHPSENELTILARDVNGLLLTGAKAAVLVKPQTINETFQPVVTLADTLLFREVDLDPSEPTRMAIPSDIFQRTNTRYEVHVRLQNTQNQVVDRATAATHFYEQYELTARLADDTVIYELFDNGVLLHNVPATLRYDFETSARAVTLPHRAKINPTAQTTAVATDKVSREIAMVSLKPDLSVLGGIEKDSFNISIHNPHKLPVSWFVYQGSALLEKGSGDTLVYKSRISDRTRTYYVELLYSFAGTHQVKREQYEFRDDHLNVNVDIPERVYPGQKIDAVISVTDQFGLPVDDVDLTAMAVTDELGYELPDLPYFGEISDQRALATHYTGDPLKKRAAELKLDYKKWEKRARLDTMKYFKFTYPGSSLFTYSTSGSGDTQFAPFVMKAGDAMGIYVIEVDRVPVYFSWSDQPKAYSFKVRSDRKVAVTLRLFDRVLILDSLLFPAGKKTILSLDLDRLPSNVKQEKINTYITRKRKRIKTPLFTKFEQARYLQYISAVQTPEKTSYLESGSSFTPLFSPEFQARQSEFILGPVVPGPQNFVSDHALTYLHEGGYRYKFDDNVVYKLNADKLIPDRLVKTSFRPMEKVNDTLMTKKAFLEYKAPRPPWHPKFLELVDYSTRVKVALPVEAAASGLASFVFEDCRTKRIISPCKFIVGEPGYATIPRGMHNAIAVYNNGTYLRMDSVELASWSRTVIDMSNLLLHPADTLSLRCLAIPFSNCFEGLPPTRVIHMRQREVLNGNIRGTVFDDENVGMPGANIVVKGTYNGTVTDADGNFALDVDESPATLVVSFIGYTTQEVEVEVGTDIKIYLFADVTQLSEVVVTGYSTVSVRGLTSSVSSALYGSIAGVDILREERAKNAVTGDSLTSGAEEKLYRELLAMNTIRKRFSDVGFWEPKLFTDKQGQSKFTVTFPDDVTRWKATVFAMNRRLQTGTGRKSITSYKPIMAELFTPNFLTVGDSALFLGKIVNHTDDDTLRGTVKWGSGAHPDTEQPVEFSDFHTDKILVQPAGSDSLAVRYSFKRDDGYLDGEERKMLVVEQGAVRADGTLSVVKNNEEVSVKAADSGQTTVAILASHLDVYAEEARHLINYKYDCNEQLASKLIGLISYKLIMHYEGKSFKYDRDINRIIIRLLKNQNEEFLWSWWNDASTTSPWMSAHILRALSTARDAGYKVDLDIANISRKAEYNFDVLKHGSLNDIALLNALAHWGARVDYEEYVPRLESVVAGAEQLMNSLPHGSSSSHVNRTSLLNEKLLLLETRQLMGLPYHADSLLRYRRDGIKGEVFFADNGSYRNWYYNDLTANTIAYRIARRETALGGLITSMQLYFLSQRNRGSWNTYYSSSVLHTVLPDLLAEGTSKKQPALIALTGAVNSTVSKFPYETHLLPGQELKIFKETGLPVFLMQYKMERVTKAASGVEGFEISTRWDEGNEVLESGKSASLVVEVTVTKEVNQEFVMIEVPIPGACSYADKASGRNAVETHREYFRDRTVIFCASMRPGTYTFVIRLLPRFTGKYILNPAQVSLMYFPVVNSNTDMKFVKVTEKE